MNLLPKHSLIKAACTLAVAFLLVSPLRAGVVAYEQPITKTEPNKSAKSVVMARNTTTPAVSVTKTETTGEGGGSAKSARKKAAYHWKCLIQSIRDISHANRSR